MYKSILVVSLSWFLIASILVPSVEMLSDLNIEWVDKMDFPLEETNKSEKDISEKEIISQSFKNCELFLFESNPELNGFLHYSVLIYPSDIFLPPPEFLS